VTREFNTMARNDKFLHCLNSGKFRTAVLIPYVWADVKGTISAEDEPLRFLMVSGKPIGEPIAWYGPIVMNTQEQLRVAFVEYHRGASFGTRRRSVSKAR
jgi:hypothetical protein